MDITALHQDPSSHRKHQLFPVGSLVEVKIDDEGMKGVFFVATVIPSSLLSKRRKNSKKKNFKKLHVEYHNLLASENGSDRLREIVDLSFVRPAPPPEEDVKSFGVSDSVDAFYKDGWWTGIIAKVLGGGRFTVTFQDPPDELEFGDSELRVHWDWCNGSWFRPENQGITSLMFEVGRKVEVSFDLEDFQGAWFPATIHEVLTNGTYLVQYHSSNNNEDQFLKATVDSLHARPCPPFLKDKNYVLLEQVDCFFNFGWWNGVITKVIEECRYTVFFEQQNKEKEFHLSELRPHMDWKDNKWFTSPSQNSKRTETGEFSQKRKRGRIRKELIDSPHVIVTGNAKNGNVASSYIGITEGDSHRENEVMMTNNLAFREPNDELTDGPAPKNSNENTEKTIKDSAIVDEVPFDEFRPDEPLLNWIRAMKTPATIKDSGLLPVSPVEECVENIDNAVRVDGSEQEDLPFAKDTVLWKTIDSMDIFQRIPQRPHFRPLVHLKESSREGLAIGCMVTFSKVVEKVSRLQINDPKSITDEVMETLADLEKYGFHVKVVEDCVDQMLQVKHKQDELREEAMEIDSQISHHNLEKQKIDEEVGEMRRQILKLKEMISMAASAKEKEESEIATLQSKLQKVEDDVKIMELEFRNLAASV